jgi:penicillin-binding protein 1A
MNVPSLKVLDTIGFDVAIDRAAALLGVTDPEQIRKTFPRVYPLGLGIISASPLRMARAFAVFGNQGREVTPIAIRYVEDRTGRVVLDMEKDLRLQQRRAGNQQVITPQNAYIMSKILEKTVEEGSLANGSGWGAKFTFKDENGKSFRMPFAGKTGTPQNWSDAWAVGYSPYYTTAIWFGFDKPGNSLGVELTGSTLAGPVWGDYMREIHKGLPRRDFVRPASGVIEVTVCAKSGLLKTPACNQGEVTLPFLSGTQPVEFCDMHGNNSSRVVYETMRDSTMRMNDNVMLSSLTMPSLPSDLFPDMTDQQNSRNQNNRTSGAGRVNNRSQSNPQPVNQQGQISMPANNPWLDDDMPISPEQESRVGTIDNPEYINRNYAVDSEIQYEYRQAPPGEPGEYPLYDLEIPSYNPLLD